MSPPSGSLPSFSTRHSPLTLQLHSISLFPPLIATATGNPGVELPPRFAHCSHEREWPGWVCGSVQELSCTPLPSQDKALKKYFMMEYYIGLKNNFKDDQVQLAYWYENQGLERFPVTWQAKIPNSQFPLRDSLHSLCGILNAAFSHLPPLTNRTWLCRFGNIKTCLGITGFCSQIVLFPY